MRKFFYILTAAIIVSLTACTKPETPSSEPEDTLSKSYVGCMRSDYPDITISGISVNDKIVYELKSACTYNSSLYPWAMTEFYASELTLEEIYAGYAFPVAEISVSTEETNNLYIYIPAKTFDDNEIIYSVTADEVSEKTNNIQSVEIKEATVIPDNEYFKTDICKFDIEITLKYGYRNAINIVYYGESIHQFIKEGIR